MCIGGSKVKLGLHREFICLYNVHKRLKGQTRVMQGVHIMPSMSKCGSKVKQGLHREPKFSLEYPQMGHMPNYGYTGSLYNAFNI